MKIKKLFSGFVCATMLLSSFPVAFANETVTNGIWNPAYVTDNTQALYEDFPMMIDNTIGRDMSMSMQFQYLKKTSQFGDVALSELTEQFGDGNSLGTWHFRTVWGRGTFCAI